MTIPGRKSLLIQRIKQMQGKIPHSHGANAAQVAPFWCGLTQGGSGGKHALVAFGAQKPEA